MSTDTRARDANRSAVYAAEQMVCSLLDDAHNCPTVRLAGSTITLPPERKFADLPSMQRWVWSIAPEVTIRATRSDATRGHYERRTATIAIPVHRSLSGQDTPHAMRAVYLLHELAHHYTPGHQHDATFCAKLTELAAEHIAPEAGFLLSVTFRESGVL